MPETATEPGPATGAGRRPADGVPPACVHDVFREVESWERRTDRAAIQLHVGQPAFRPPAAVRDVAAAAIRDGRTGYTAAEGTPELREALVDKLVGTNGHETDAEHVIVAPGSTQGLLAVLTALAEPGARMLLPWLHWPVHLQQGLLAGLRPAFYPLAARGLPDLEWLAGVPVDGPVVLLVNSPSNPLGSVADRAHCEALLEIAHRRRWTVVSDEAYEDFVFDGHVHTSLAALESDVPRSERRVYSAFTFSKSHGMTGYRLGYVAAPTPRAAATLRVVQEASIMCPASPVQAAGIAALAARRDRAANVDHVATGRALGADPLVRAGLLESRPDGGWYAVFDVGVTGLDAGTFTARLLESTGVSLAPADGFALRPVTDRDGRVTGVTSDPAARSLVRMAFCGPHDAVAEGADRVVAFAKGA